MSQDNMLKLECTECKRINYYSHKNKKKLNKFKLELNKFCPHCGDGKTKGKHTLHKETK